MCECFACMRSVHRVHPEAHRGGRRVSEPLELELQVVLNCHVGAGSRTSILCRIELLTAELFLHLLFLAFASKSHCIAQAGFKLLVPFRISS